jgi:hypothetical protein
MTQVSCAQAWKANMSFITSVSLYVHPYPSVCPHRTWPPLRRFSQNVILPIFTKTCHENLCLIKIRNTSTVCEVLCIFMTTLVTNVTMVALCHQGYQCFCDSPVCDEQVANICRKDVCCYQQQWRRWLASTTQTVAAMLALLVSWCCSSGITLGKIPHPIFLCGYISWHLSPRR